MARISFKLPADIADEQCRAWLEQAIAAGKPGPEFQSIRAHSPGVMRSFTETRGWIFHQGALDFALKELVRAYIALSGDCAYCSNQGVARALNADRDQRDALLDYQHSEKILAPGETGLPLCRRHHVEPLGRRRRDVERTVG
jgi:alkylhydroperoxidase family enzyme